MDKVREELFHSALRLTANSMDPLCPFNDVDVEKQKRDVECLELEEDVPPFEEVVWVEKGCDGRDHLAWKDAHPGADRNPAEHINTTANVALDKC